MAIGPQLAEVQESHVHQHGAAHREPPTAKSINRSVRPQRERAAGGEKGGVAARDRNSNNDAAEVALAAVAVCSFPAFAWRRARSRRSFPQQPIEMSTWPRSDVFPAPACGRLRL